MIGREVAYPLIVISGLLGAGAAIYKNIDNVCGINNVSGRGRETARNGYTIAAGYSKNWKVMP